MKQEPINNLANQLSASRFVLAVVLFVLIHFKVWWACLAVFVVATVTDWLDGYVARRQGTVSALGRMLDPLADKVLTCGAFLFLLPTGMQEGWLWPWMVAVVIMRELIITGLRGFLESEGIAFGADWLGKSKMLLQCAALIAIFVVLPYPTWPLPLIRDVLIWAMVVVTALSGIQYLVKATALLRRP